MGQLESMVLTNEQIDIIKLLVGNAIDVVEEEKTIVRSCYAIEACERVKASLENILDELIITNTEAKVELEIAVAADTQIFDEFKKAYFGDWSDQTWVLEDLN